MAELWPTRRANLSDLLDQNFSDQFKRPVVTPHPREPPAAVQNEFGFIGQGRPHRFGRAPIFWEEEEEEEEEEEDQDHVIHLLPQLHNQHPGPMAPIPEEEEEEGEEPLAEAAQEHRPMCCCFCFGTAARRAERLHLPPPEKDAEGPWSTHHSMVDGIVECPALRRVVCGWCGATGDLAHTTRWHENNLPIPYRPIFH